MAEYSKVPLQEWVEARLTALDKRVADVDERAKEAIREARVSADASQVRQNEWRATVNDLASSKIERTVVQAMMEAMSDRIDRITRVVDGMQGKASGVGVSVSIILSITAIAAVVIFGVLQLMHGH